MNGPCDSDALEALVYGELTEPREQEVERHAGSCATCKQELQWLRAERDAMSERANQTPSLSPALWDAIENSIGQPGAEPASRADAPIDLASRRKSRWVGFGIAGAVAAAAAILLLLLPPGTETSGNPVVQRESDAAPAPASAAPVAPRADSLADAERAVSDAEAAHLAALVALQDAYADRKKSLSSELAAQYDREFQQTREVLDLARQTAGSDLERRVRLLDAYSAHRRAMQAVVYSLEETKP